MYNAQMHLTKNLILRLCVAGRITRFALKYFQCRIIHRVAAQYHQKLDFQFWTVNAFCEPTIHI